VTASQDRRSVDPAEFRVHLHGPKADDAAAVGEVLVALDGLFSAVADEMGHPDVRLAVTGFKCVCDGCGIERPAEHADWIHDAGDDFCPSCQRRKGVTEA
jgi:hypothetical protein